MSNKINILFALFFSLLFIGCATQKDAEAELKGLKKAMKNLNARFNGLHNSRELLKEHQLANQTSRRDNYNQVLALYDEEAADGAGGGAQLDPVIEKASVVISLYRQSKWTDDAYMQIGMGEYYKGNLDEAAQTFNYIISNFDPKLLVRNRAEALKRSKDKKDRKKGRDMLQNPKPEKKDRNTRQRDAMVWLARTLVSQEKFAEADLLIEQIEGISDLSKKLKRDLTIVKSYYQLRQKNYAAAIPALQTGLKMTGNKKRKTRLTYILAQLHELQGNNTEALANYKRVKRLRPNYDMEFRSSLNIATNGMKSGSASSEQTLASLKRMSKDSKNTEFRDQIFYVMADIHLQDKNQPEAIDFLKQSLRANRGNQPQKADSYYRLADIYFNSEDYIQAKNYYDSTKTAMTNTDDRYEQVVKYSEALTDIAANLEIIALQDSLLRIKDMSREEQEELAKRLKKERLDAQKKEVTDAFANMENAMKNGGASRNPSSKLGRPAMDDSGLRPGGITGPSASERSDYWAYNDNEVRRGKRDFERTWGDRPLEDNWRRSAQSQGTDIIEDDGVIAGFGRVKVTDEEIKAILADVPQTRKEVEAVNAKIIDALYALGGLFDEKLDKPEKSIEAYEELLRRFPGNKYEAEALYAMYTIALEHFPSKANGYKQQLLKKHADSKFAVFLTNPEMLAEAQRGEDDLEIYYDETYLMYETGSYGKAKSRISMADSLFEANTLRAKFDLLNALCVGHTDGEDAYKASLNEVITKHKATDEGKKAEEILAFLEGKTPPKQGKGNKPDEGEKGKKEKEAKELYVMDEEMQHYVLVILSTAQVKSSEVKGAVSNYHKEHHKLDKLFTASLLLNKNTQMLVIRRFKNADIAQRYAKSVSNKPAEYLNNLDEGYRVFPISQNNYKSLLRSKKLEEYAAFYAENYN